MNATTQSETGVANRTRFTKTYELEMNGGSIEIEATIQHDRKIKGTLEEELDSVVKLAEKKEDNPLSVMEKLSEFPEISVSANSDLVIPAGGSQ